MCTFAKIIILLGSTVFLFLKEGRSTVISFKKNEQNLQVIGQEKER